MPKTSDIKGVLRCRSGCVGPPTGGSLTDPRPSRSAPLKSTKARKGTARKSRLEGVVSELSLMDQPYLFDRQGCKAWLPMRLRGGYLELGSLASVESGRDSVSWTAVREKR